MAPLFIGSGDEAGSQQAMQVVYDTGSDWLTIEGTDCKVCQGKMFDYHKSESFKFLERVQHTDLAYGSAELKGLRATDKVCLPKSKDLEGLEAGVCLPSFEFFLVSSQQGLAGRIDGVLGLSRNALPKNLKDDWRGTGPLYIHHLAKAGLIKENVFAFFLESYSDNKTLNSFIDIGGTVEQHMHPDREIVWFSLKDHMYWMVTGVAGMRINGDDDSAYSWLKHSEKPYEAIFDSGTSLTMVP